jgi:hypothetical protein
MLKALQKQTLETYLHPEIHGACAGIFINFNQDTRKILLVNLPNIGNYKPKSIQLKPNF